MTRKCCSCGSTKELKGIVKPECDCEKCRGWHKTSVCKPCYFETCSCEMDGHEVTDCLKDETCENHKLTVGLHHNWNDYDYKFKLKSSEELK
jgi:hypothetical protein